MAILTFADCIDALVDFARVAPSGVSITAQTHKRAVMQAYDDIATAADWSFLKKTHRITLQAPQETGTVTFDLTGGTYERELTLTGATWPSWAADASIQIGDTLCEVDEVKSSTVLTLTEGASPVADQTGVTYSLYPTWYLLPEDFASLWNPMDESAWQLGERVSPARMAALQRYEHATSGDIQYYSIVNAEDYYNRHALAIWPKSDATESLDIPYRRLPRALRHSGRDASDHVGTAAGSADATTVTGTNTAFADTMVGSVLRLSSDTTPPTGWGGKSPRLEEHVINSVTSATVLDTKADLANTVSGVAYVISDPIDLPQFMHNALLRTAESYIAGRIGLDPQRHERAMDRAIRKAKATEGGMIRERRIAGQESGHVVRLADATSRPEVSS